MPLSWSVAFLVVFAVLYFVANAQAKTVSQLLSGANHGVLLVVIPALLLGKTLGLMGTNVLAYFSPMRVVFEAESREVGRDSFGRAIQGLAKVSVVLSLVMCAGVVLYFRVSQ